MPDSPQNAPSVPDGPEGPKMPQNRAQAAGTGVTEPTSSLPVVPTDESLAALPDGSVIWYWITYDAVEIHQQLMKHGDWWRNANDPDDDFAYVPTTKRLTIWLLRHGWTAPARPCNPGGKP